MLCFQTSAGLFCLVMFWCMSVVGYLDVLSEVHISMFVRWMYILVRPCHKYFLYSMCTIVGSIPIHFIVNCIACVRVLWSSLYCIMIVCVYTVVVHALATLWVAYAYAMDICVLWVAELVIYIEFDVTIVNSLHRKTRGMGAGRKLKTHRRNQRWADKAYKKSHLGNEWKKPFAGSSHAKGIVLEKMYVW